MFVEYFEDMNLIVNTTSNKQIQYDMILIAERSLMNYLFLNQSFLFLNIFVHTYCIILLEIWI